MRECPACGEELDDGVVTCWKCGADDDDDEQGADPGLCSDCGAELGDDALSSVEEPRPLCEECRIANELSEEDDRACPVDESLLEREEYRGVVVDRCPICGGVWLDEGKLERIERAGDTVD